MWDAIFRFQRPPIICAICAEPGGLSRRWDSIAGPPMNRETQTKMKSTQSPPPLSRNTALFLDFDGCLVEIADRPDAVIVPPTLPDLLRRLHDELEGAVALITGRNIADLRGHLRDFPGAIAGSHGAELALPGQEIATTHQQDFDLASLHAAARVIADPHPQLLIETKPHGVGIHYRADPALQAYVETEMEGLLPSFPGLMLQKAKMAVELRPQGTSKAGALAQLMRQPPFAGRAPVYAGDDLTDEIAMAEAQSLGGFGVKIGEGKTVARYRLPDPAAVARWLAATIRVEG
jgi:trehalose 6-phosphate phosphatase